MDEIRDIISSDINPNNFHGTQDQILENLQEAFKKHQENLNNLSTKKWKFTGQDIGSWLVIGGIEVAAALTGTPAWGLAGLTANQLFDSPKLKDIPKSIKEKIHKSLVGVLFNIQQKIKI